MNDPLTVTIDRDIFDLAEGFLRNRREQAVLALAAVEARDLVTLRRIGHELKGTAGSFGFSHLSKIGNRLEEAAVAGNLHACEEAVVAMSDFLDRVAITPG